MVTSHRRQRPLRHLSAQPQRQTVLSVVSGRRFRQLYVHTNLIILRLRAVIHNTTMRITLGKGRLGDTIYNHTLRLLNRLLINLYGQHLRRTLSFTTNMPHTDNIRHPNSGGSPCRRDW